MYKYGFSVNTELKILSVNRRFEPLYGRKCGRLEGEYYYNVIPRICRDNCDAVEQAIAGGAKIVLEGYGMNCLCGFVTADITITPLFDQVLGIIGAGIVIRVKPDCILSDKIDQSKLLVDIGKSSASLAHGVRSPLNAIKGAIVYLKDNYSRDPLFAEFSQIIEDEISRLDRFITRFLSSTLSDSEVADIDVNALLEEILKMVRLQANAKRIEIVAQLANVPQIKAEPFQFKHAILNVVNNAIEAVQDGGSISVRTMLHQEHGKNMVSISIRDSGCGFSEGDFTGELNRESVKGGRGYGLFITHEIVKSLGGFLEIDSDRSSGTVVEINIPL